MIGPESHVLLRIMSNEKTDVLRLPRRHAPKVTREITPEDGLRLVNAQSLRNALVGGLIAIIVFCVLWSMLSALVDRFFPWLALLLGLLVGRVVQRAGRGVDWRFPVLAAVLAIFGSLAGNIVVAATFTAAEFDTGTLTILGAVTSMTWPVFFTEVLTPADFVYGLFSAWIAAFFANRRLNRAEYLALRRWREASKN